jgi:hypothetical protein
VAEFAAKLARNLWVATANLPFCVPPSDRGLVPAVVTWRANDWVMLAHPSHRSPPTPHALERV